MELFDGDQISLVKKDNIPEEHHHLIRKLEYELFRMDGEEKAGRRDLPGEILVQTTTEPIIIDDSETEESSNVKTEEKQPDQCKVSMKKESAVKVKCVTFADDYEIGEPSRIPRPPTPPKPPKTDPVSIVSFNSFLTRKIFGSSSIAIDFQTIVFVLASSQINMVYLVLINSLILVVSNSFFLKKLTIQT